MLDDLIHRRARLPYTLHIERLRWPSRSRATLVMIHGIGSSTAMWRSLANELPDDVRVIAVDLLGFGRSPQPGWAKYDAHTQARSLIKTLLLHRIPLGSIFIGHSLGALVAVETARQLPRYPSHLMLISPPIYRPSRQKIVATQRDDVLRGVYKILKRYPKNTERALLLAKRYYVKKNGLSVAPGLNIDTYLLALESSIVNQDTINSIVRVRPKATLMSGSRDPLVVKKNLQRIAESSRSIEHIQIKGAGHNVVGVMRSAVAQRITELLRES